MLAGLDGLVASDAGSLPPALRLILHSVVVQNLSIFSVVLGPFLAGDSFPLLLIIFTVLLQVQDPFVVEGLHLVELLYIFGELLDAFLHFGDHVVLLLDGVFHEEVFGGEEADLFLGLLELPLSPRQLGVLRHYLFPHRRVLLAPGRLQGHLVEVGVVVPEGLHDRDPDQPDVFGGALFYLEILPLADLLDDGRYTQESRILATVVHDSRSLFLRETSTRAGLVAYSCQR